MKNWNTPVMEELEISNTERAFETGTVPDSYHHDTLTGVEVAYRYNGNSGVVAL